MNLNIRIARETKNANSNSPSQKTEPVISAYTELILPHAKLLNLSTWRTVYFEHK